MLNQQWKHELVSSIIKCGFGLAFSGVSAVFEHNGLVLQLGLIIFSDIFSITHHLLHVELNHFCIFQSTIFGECSENYENSHVCMLWLCFLKSLNSRAFQICQHAISSGWPWTQVSLNFRSVQLISLPAHITQLIPLLCNQRKSNYWKNWWRPCYLICLSLELHY